MSGAGRVDVAIVGGGMVGSASALACLERGLTVALLDPGELRDAASYGNAGVISRGSLFPMAMPGLLSKLPTYALNRSAGIRVDYGSLLSAMPWFLAFIRRCNEGAVREAAKALDPLCAASYDEHWRVAGEIGARHLIEQRGWVKLYRTEAAFAASQFERELLAQYRVGTEIIDGPELTQFEPALKRGYAKGLWFTETGSVTDPGGLVELYLEAARLRGAQILKTRASAIEELADGARVRLDGGGTLDAGTVVLAAGAAAGDLARTLGYRIPFAAERGYHRHFEDAGAFKLSRPINDIEGAYVVSPMKAGLRVLTGVELAHRNARRNLAQMALAEAEAAGTVALGPGVEAEAWHGSRPSTPDGLPVIGRAPRHRHVIFAFGHNHIGLGTGPITGKVVAELVTGATSSIPIEAFSAARF
jgi:D-amino-acid dehydrogenase